MSLDTLLETLLRQFAVAGVEQPARPGAEENMIKLDDGMWALRTGHPISADTVNDTIDALRRERDLFSIGISR